MKVDELKQGLATLAEETENRGIHERLVGIDGKVASHRRAKWIGTGVVAMLAIAAAAIAPGILDTNADRTPAANDDRHAGFNLPTVSDHGTTFYTDPAGARLIGHGVADPGATEVSFSFTPSTLDLAWEGFCWDPTLAAAAQGADYSTFVNGNPVSGSTCQDSPGPYPVAPTGSFGSSPSQNVNAWADLGVVVGKPSTFTLRITGHAGRSIAPQLGGAVYERGTQQRIEEIWYPQQVVFDDHTYQAVASNVRGFEGRKPSQISIGLPRADHAWYVFRGADHVHGGVNVSAMGHLPAGVPGGGTGDLVPIDDRTFTVTARGLSPDSRGTIYVVVYKRID
ncbi:MAG TPA: hypothetical protein VH419_09175 [Nocardioidaceae bacterium]|jgi:hypothetical protein